MSADLGAERSRSSRDVGLTLTNADFKSDDVGLGNAPRATDGSLPAKDFLHPSASSKLIDVDVDGSLPSRVELQTPDALEAP